MRRAVDLFEFETGSARSPLVEQVWRTRSVPEDTFIAVAASHWEMVVTRQDGRAELTVLGPATRATTAGIPEDAEFLGIHFSVGTFMPVLPPGTVVDRGMTLSPSTRSTVWLDGYRIELPGRDDVDSFVAALVRRDLLVTDPVVANAVGGRVDDLSVRSVERRVLRATGLTRGGIRQIRRAERAVELLRQGLAPIDVALAAGYSDQPHLTRSLRRFAGQTPAQIASAAVAG
ncbi:MAG TPA: AraC family transcriptional regulator [Solirubrobacteraceae bacterium]|jgi:hypothetical protein